MTPPPTEFRQWDATGESTRPADVLRLAPDCRIVLVGNGPSVLRAQLGMEIDAHEEVVRFNTFHVRGFVPHVGAKTTLWATFGRGVLPADADIRPGRIILTHGESKGPPYVPRELFRIPRSYFDAIRAKVQSASQLAADARKALLPSSGLLVAAWLREVAGVNTVTLAGFDHFSQAASRMHHYWIPFNKVGFTRPKEHDGDAEALIFAKWAEDGRVRYLTQEL